jgi:predicted  nucleic acid-binding Zn-ribbon protein
MPTSLDPQPDENEIECGRCGAYFHYELTRCPNCGVNIYEPEADQEPSHAPAQRENWFRILIRRLTQKPHPADQLFGAAINQAELFSNLQTKVGGDRTAAERLVEFERQKNPLGNRIAWLNQAIQRWERDNHANGTG